MSFILEAIKKSEERRQKEDPIGSRKRILNLGESSQRRWPFWLLLALLPAALLAGWWLGRSPQPSLQAATKQTTPIRQTTETQMAIRSAVQTKENQAVPDIFSRQTGLTEATAGKDKTTPAKVEKTQKKTVSQGSLSAPPMQAPVPRQPLERATISQQPAVPAAQKPKGLEPPTYEELPWTIQERLPRLNISLHFFSTTPTRRIVRINGRLLHEGESISEDLSIHEITDTATILRYQGQLFRIEGPGG